MLIFLELCFYECCFSCFSKIFNVCLMTFWFVKLYFYECCHPCYHKKNRQTDRKTKRKTLHLKSKTLSFIKFYRYYNFMVLIFTFPNTCFLLGLFFRSLVPFRMRSNSIIITRLLKITVFSFLIWAKYQKHQNLFWVT